MLVDFDEGHDHTFDCGLIDTFTYTVTRISNTESENLGDLQIVTDGFDPVIVSPDDLSTVLW